MTERIRKKYNFKSVGISSQILEDIVEVEEDLPGLSFKTPLAPAEQSFGSTFEVHTDVRSVVRDNLRNLLSTNYGERLGEWDLGANLVEFVAELEAGFDVNSIIDRVQSTTLRWMNYIQVQDVQVDRTETSKGLAGYSLRVVYQAPDLFEGSDAVVVSFAYM
jgi:phage baseplate assembly protein W